MGLEGREGEEGLPWQTIKGSGNEETIGSGRLTWRSPPADPIPRGDSQGRKFSGSGYHIAIVTCGKSGTGVMKGMQGSTTRVQDWQYGTETRRGIFG